MHTNLFKRALQERRQQIGLWLGLADSYSAEICGGAGFDWLLIDGEHAPNTLQTTLAQLQTLASFSVEPIVRPAWNDPVLIKQLLDIGAQTLLVPMIQSRQEAEAAVSAMRYPSQGIRGVGSALARASSWSREPNYLHRANDQMCTLVQIETQQGIAALDEILQTERVDGVFIGPADLAANMGHLGNPEHPDVRQAIDAAIVRIAKAGKAPGILYSNPERAQHFLDLGALFVAVGVDTVLLARAAENLRRQFKIDSTEITPTLTSGPY